MGRTAILFWCYKDAKVCEDRVRVIRHNNPHSPIYVLFGGNPNDAPKMQATLESYIDDFWSYDQDRSSYWKWKHGDRLLARWYTLRGVHLPDWDDLFLAQWDMLVAAPLDELIKDKPSGSTLFTGVLPISEVKDWWFWVRGFANSVHLLLFRLILRLFNGYTGPVLSAPFIIVCVPREYMSRLAHYPFSSVGFLEYTCPTLAAAWGFENWSTPQLEAWRPANPRTRDVSESEKIVSAAKAAVPTRIVCDELLKPSGSRVFHPVHGTDQELGLTRLLYKELPA